MEQFFLPVIMESYLYKVDHFVPARVVIQSTNYPCNEIKFLIKNDNQQDIRSFILSWLTILIT